MNAGYDVIKMLREFMSHPLTNPRRNAYHQYYIFLRPCQGGVMKLLYGLLALGIVLLVVGVVLMLT